MTRIFISHSHSDEAIAYKLFDFLMSALKLEDDNILCTSAPNSGLSFNSNYSSERLKTNLKDADALVALITTDSLRSLWIPFEIGSFWSTEKTIVLILGPNLTPSNLPGPLKGWLSIRVEDDRAFEQLNEVINQLEKKLDIRQNVNRFRRDRHLNEFITQLRAWKSQLPDQDRSESPQIEELAERLEEPESNRFKIALSFPGEHRDFVLKVAESLAARLTRQRVFYDEWYETELLGVGGDLKLQSMYERADLVVPFFSQYYSKPWCSLEWETIRGILLKRRKEDAVIPVHLDDTDIPGWSAVNFGIRLRGRTPQKIADIILQALAMRNPTKVSQQERIEELTEKLEELEAASSQEKEELKEELEQNYQKQKQDNERTLYYQIKQLEEQLDQERWTAAEQQANLQAAQEKVVEKESTIAQLPEQIEQLKSSPQVAVTVEVELKSEKGVDYTKLRDLLKQHSWKEADKETAAIMLVAAGREKEGWLDIMSIDNFPCEDLRTINQLWLHYSKGKFGFSVQKEIYEELGGTREYNYEVWKDFGDRVGWRSGKNWMDYNKLTFNLKAPQAHLPGVILCFEGGRKKGIFFSSLAQRLVTFKI